jgi:hypothetical protein
MALALAMAMEAEGGARLVAAGLPLYCFFCVPDVLGATRIGGAPEGDVAGWGFLACFGFFTSRLLRI